jgi:hypothetical protein
MTRYALMLAMLVSVTSVNADAKTAEATTEDTAEEVAAEGEKEAVDKAAS